MEEQIKNAIEFLKEQPIQGCITGSCLLEYFENQDVDIFTYTEASFRKLLFAMYHNPLFTILDPKEKWKFDEYINKNQSSLEKFGLTTIKFTYNTCVLVNITFKKNTPNIFSVLSTFDMDIICKGYDIESKQYLDLRERTDKIATWNKWNVGFYSDEIWKLSRILRQIERCFKYHKRGYNVDAVVLKYIELIDKLQDYTNIFNSEVFDERLDIIKKNTLIVKQICQTWLETHVISDSELEKLKLKIKEI